MSNNFLIVLSGPSGVGKGTIVTRLLARGNYALSVSATTRPPRKGEENGKSYFFLSREEFAKGIKEGGFLEYSEHFGNFYGTPKKFVDEKLKKSDVILEIDVDGALAVRKSHPAALLIFILPPSREELRNRLLSRGSEDVKKIEERLERTEYELSKSGEYDYRIVNDELERAVEEIESAIALEKRRKND